MQVSVVGGAPHGFAWSWVTLFGTLAAEPV